MTRSELDSFENPKAAWLHILINRVHQIVVDVDNILYNKIDKV